MIEKKKNSKENKRKVKGLHKTSKTFVKNIIRRKKKLIITYNNLPIF